MTFWLDVPGLVEWVNFVSFVVAKHIDAKLILLFNLSNVTEWCWKSNPFSIYFADMSYVFLVSICIFIGFYRV